MLAFLGAMHTPITGQVHVHLCIGAFPKYSMDVYAVHSRLYHTSEREEFSVSSVPTSSASPILPLVRGVIDMQVYYHHHASSYVFLGTLGTETRGKNSPIPLPYGRVINGTKLADEQWRKTNIELVNQGRACSPALHACVSRACRKSASPSQCIAAR